MEKRRQGWKEPRPGEPRTALAETDMWANHTTGEESPGILP